MKGRIYLILFLTIVGFVAVIGKLFMIQVLNHSLCSEMSIRQSSQSKRFERQRGTIYDRRGRELAISVRVHSLAANPRKFPTTESREAVADRLASVIPVDRDVILARLEHAGEFTWLARKLGDPEAEAVAAMKIPGLFFETEYKRYYPHDSSAAHVIGFVGTDDIGLEGIESSQNEVLRGPDVVGKFVTDVHGNPVPVDGIIRYPEFNGHAVHLTIDLAIQSSLEQAIARQIETFGAKSASGIVVDPVSGEILALANYPTFNPNDLENSDASERRNRALTDAFEPGSTFKVFSGVIGLEQGAVKIDDRFNCPGYLNVAGRPVKCHLTHGAIDYSDVIALSCNVGAMLVAQRLDPAVLYRGLRAFGFGEKTGIDLAGEARGVLRPVEEWSGGSNSMLGIGQEISVTTLQLAMATACMANGGRLMAPHIISKIANAKGQSMRSFPPDVRSNPVDPRAARMMSSIMEGVVTRGTGQLAAVKPFAVSGKTGTAQISGSHGGYIEGRYNAVFIGWTPSEAPVLSMAIVVRDPDPSKGYYGGQVAAPIFSWVGTEAMQYLGIRPAWGRDTVVSSLKPKRISDRQRGVVVAGKVRVPDLKGLSMREALELMASLPLVLKPNGSGLAVYQSPAAGQIVAIDSVLRVDFVPPGGSARFADIAQ